MDWLANWQWLGWLASAVFLVRLLPQPLKLWRTGVPDGVSPLGAINGAVSDVAWLIHGIAVGLAPVWAVSALACPPSIWLVVLLRRSTRRSDVLGGVLWLSAVVIGAITGQMTAVLAFSVVVNQGPQVWEALRNDDLSGVAVGTWLVAFADASLWGAYGVAVGDAALVAYGIVLFTASAVVLGRVAITRRAGTTLPAVALAEA